MENNLTGALSRDYGLDFAIKCENNNNNMMMCMNILRRTDRPYGTYI